MDKIDELLDDYYYIRKWYEEACEEIMKKKEKSIGKNWI